jgi:hypothetical protein
MYIQSDNTTRVLGLYNRGDWGTGHGWTGTNQVAWNVAAADNQIVIQKPPLGQNYAVGCKGNITHIGPFNPHPAGWIEGTGEDIFPASLYEAQLSERLTFGVGPDAPARLNYTDYSYTDNIPYVKLEWMDIALDEDRYIVERSADGGSTFEAVADLPENTQSFTDTGLHQVQYHYRVKAVNGIGSSAWSNILPVDLLSGVKNRSDRESISVFPNPARDVLTIKTSEPLRKAVFYDMAGRIMKLEGTRHGGEVRFNVRDLADGIYIVLVYFGHQGVAVNKIIKHGYTFSKP